MTNTDPNHSSPWVAFTYVSFFVSLAAIAGGIVLLPIELWMRAYLFIGMLMLVQSCFTLSKTLRDRQENSRLVNRIEEARTEKLLMGQ